MKKLEVKHKDGWHYNPDELRKLTERVNGQEYGEAMSMEEVEAVLLAIDESPSTETGQQEVEKDVLYIFNGIEGDLEEVESADELKQYIKDYTEEEEGIHPDIESIILLKKIGGIECIPIEGKEDTYKVKPYLAASQPQEGQDESVKCIISDNLYNIRGSNQQGLFDTDKCDEIASFILQDILKEFTIIKK